MKRIAAKCGFQLATSDPDFSCAVSAETWDPIYETRIKSLWLEYL